MSKLSRPHCVSNMWFGKKRFWNSSGGLSGISPMMCVSIITPSSQLTVTRLTCWQLTHFMLQLIATALSIPTIVSLTYARKTKQKKQKLTLDNEHVYHSPHTNGFPCLFLSLLSLTLRRAELALSVGHSVVLCKHWSRASSFSGSANVKPCQKVRHKNRNLIIYSESILRNVITYC